MLSLVVHVGIEVANIGEKIHNMRLRVMFFFVLQCVLPSKIAANLPYM